MTVHYGARGARWERQQREIAARTAAADRRLEYLVARLYISKGLPRVDATRSAPISPDVWERARVDLNAQRKP